MDKTTENKGMENACPSRKHLSKDEVKEKE
jgi:hypothetical protein